MSIYKRQMEKLGLNLEQYSKLVGMPIEITKKLINGKEVVENMQINNFLRNNIFNKHQEIEKGGEMEQEAINIKIEDSDIFSHPKIQNLIEKYPNSEELYWYLTKFNKEEYFEKYNVVGWQDLMRRYDFVSNAGRIKGKVCDSTIQRVIKRQYDEVGAEVIYEIAQQLYDCFEKGNIRPFDISTVKRIPRKSVSKDNVLITENENELRNWYKEFDFNKFIKEHDMTIEQFGKKVYLAISTTFAFIKKYAQYKPSLSVLQRVKNYVESCDTNVEQNTNVEQITIEETTKINDNTTIVPMETGVGIIVKPTDENSMLKELLKERLTEQEKYLIRLFGGNI